MTLYLIARDPELASEAIGAGVDFIFVDLEELGKAERQKGRGAVFSGHTVADVARVRQSVPAGRLLVRTNPYHAGSAAEVEAVLAAGADRLMLPMFRHVGEVEQFLSLVRGRAPVVLLVETRAALENIADFAGLGGVAGLHLGLNDLAIEYRFPFLFEVVAAGLVDRAFYCARAAHPEVHLGFGGVGRLDAMPISGRLILGEHHRLGSRAVILSRVFHGNSQTLGEVREKGIDLRAEVGAVRRAIAALEGRGPDEVEADHQEFCRAVTRAGEARAAAGGS